jgi:hypothetical protein
MSPPRPHGSGRAQLWPTSLLFLRLRAPRRSHPVHVQNFCHWGCVVTWTMFVLFAALTCLVVGYLPSSVNAKGNGGTALVVIILVSRVVVALALIAATLLAGGAL